MMYPDFIPREKLLLLFDGQCPLCLASVRFLLARDHKDKLRFASLQEESIQSFLVERNLLAMDTLVGLRQGKVFVYSRAVAAALYELGGIWRILSKVIGLFPANIADGVYRFIARHRLRIFRKKEYCQLPDPSQANKFIKFG
jgi:predicted DCC family thiol-disulfide oxidoreductase YuxK